MKLVLGGFVNTSLAEYLQTELAREGILENILEKDGKKGYRIPAGYIFILDDAWRLRIERKWMVSWKEVSLLVASVWTNGASHILEYDLREIGQKYLKPQELTGTRKCLDALKNEMLFEQAILSGEKEKVREILSHTPDDIKHLRFINVIRSISERNSVCINGKEMSGFWALRHIFTKQIASDTVQIDFLGDTGIAKDILVYDLFGDMSFLQDKKHIYQLGGFDSSIQEQYTFEYLTDSWDRLNLHEGENITMSNNEHSLQKAPEKKQEPKKNPDSKKNQQQKKEKKPIKKPTREESKGKSSLLHENTLLQAREKKFLKEFGSFIEAISVAYAIPKNHFLSLIERESSFNPSKDDNLRSFGYMQLTSSVFSDMKYEYVSSGWNRKTVGQWGRGYLYENFFLRAIQDNPRLLDASLIDQIPSNEGRKLFRKIGECAREGVDETREKEQYDSIIVELYRLAHKDPYVNILIWAIFYEWVRKEWKNVRTGKTKDIFDIHTAIENDIPKLKDATLIKFVLQWRDQTKEQIKEILAQKKRIISELRKRNERTYLDFYSLYRYNGDTKREIGESLPHRLYFALNILIKERLKDNRDKTK